MSILKSHRKESKAQYVATAYQIQVESINFLSRLSSRYSRILTPTVSQLACEVATHAIKANDIYPSDESRVRLRKDELLQSRAALSALDAELSICYDVLCKNPQGSFTTRSGAFLNKTEAVDRLDKMSQNLGELIDSERRMLTSLINKK